MSATVRQFSDTHYSWTADFATYPTERSKPYRWSQKFGQLAMHHCRGRRAMSTSFFSVVAAISDEADESGVMDTSVAKLVTRARSSRPYVSLVIRSLIRARLLVQVREHRPEVSAGAIYRLAWPRDIDMEMIAFALNDCMQDERNRRRRLRKKVEELGYDPSDLDETGSDLGEQQSGADTSDPAVPPGGCLRARGGPEDLVETPRAHKHVPPHAHEQGDPRAREHGFSYKAVKEVLGEMVEVEETGTGPRARKDHFATGKETSDPASPVASGAATVRGSSGSVPPNDLWQRMRRDMRARTNADEEERQ